MKRTNILLTIIIAVGFLARIIAVDSNPVSLYWDEASIGYEAYAISQTGMDMHGNHFLQAIFPAYGDYKAPVYIWLASIAIKLFGPTNFAVRLPSVIAGTLSIVGMFYLGNVLFKNKKSGLYASLVFALLPTAIHFSRAGFEANLALTFILWSLLALIIGLETQKNRWTVMASIGSVLAVYTYFSARIVIPLMAIAVWAFVRKSKQSLMSIGLFAIIFVIGLIPLYRSPYFDDANTLRLSTDNITNNQVDIVRSNTLKAVDENSVISRLFHHRYMYMGKELVVNMFGHFDPNYLFFKGDPNARHSTGYAGIMLSTMAPLFFIGLASMFKDKPKIVAFLMGLWFLFLLPASVPRTIPHALRSLNSLIPIALFISFGMIKLDEWAKKSQIIKWGALLLMCCVVIQGLTYATLVGTLYAGKSATSWQDGYPQLGSYVATQYAKYDYIHIPPGDRLFLYILFYGQFSPTLTQLQPTVLAPDKIGKMTFKPVVWQDDSQGPSRSLIIGAKNDFPEEVTIKDEIKDSNGETQFVSVDLSDL